MQADTALTPCPFCGGATRHLEERTGFWTERAICDTCNFHLTRTHTESAVARWNRRAPTAPPAQEARVPLSDEQIDRGIAELGLNYLADAHVTNRAVLRKLCRHVYGITAAQKGTPC